MTLFEDSDYSDPILDENKNYLEELVGEGKKFSDPNALARGKYEADQFVERLKNENAGLRTELNSRVKMEEFLDKLNTSSQRQSPDAGQQPSDTAKAEAGLKPEGVTLTRDGVINLLDQREKQAKASQNVDRVKQHLQETLGPNYANKLKQAAQGLGLSTEHLNNLAQTSPEALYKLLGVDDRKPDVFQAPPRNQMTPSFQPKSQERTWDYYQDYKKKEPTKYWSAAVQNQMHQDAMRLGEKFKT